MNVADIFSFIEENVHFHSLPIDRQNEFKEVFYLEFYKASSRGLFYAEKFENCLIANVDHSLSKSDLYLKIENCIRLVAASFDATIIKFQKCVIEYILDQIFNILEPTLYYLDDDKPSNLLISINELQKIYPVLWYRLVKLVGFLFDFFHLAFSRIIHDQTLLLNDFGADVNSLINFKILESDPHNGHQRVICFYFTKKVKIVYKPRPLNGEAYFNEIIKLLSPSLNLKELKIYNAGQYGYVKWIGSSQSYKGNICYELGNLLGAKCFAGLTDLHAENIILSKSGLHVIDAAAIGLKSLDFTTQNFLRNPNVLDVGMLPSPEGFSQKNWWDISACGFTENSNTIPVGIRYYKNGNSPRFIKHYLKKKYSYIKSALTKVEVNALQAEFNRGFTDVCKTLDNIKIIPPDTNEFRYIHRPTGIYHRTLLRMTDYSCSKDVRLLYNEVDPYIAEIKNDAFEGSGFSPLQIIAIEMVSLLFGDIPRLSGLHLKASLPKNTKLNVCSIPDASASAKLIAGTLSLLRVNNKNSFTYDGLNFHITNINTLTFGNYLANIIVPDIKEKVVYGLKTNIESGVPKFTRLEYSFYNGLSGTYLFLVVCNDLNKSGQDQIIESLDTIFFSQFELQIKEKKPQSVSDGIIGILYSYCFLHNLGIRKEKYFALIERLVTIMPDNLSSYHNDSMDVVSGVAGLLLIFDAIENVIKHSKITKLKKE